MSSAKFIPPSKKPPAIVRPSGTRPIKVGLFSEHQLDLQRKRNRNFPEPLPAGTCLHSFTEVRKLRTGETTSKKNASTEHDVYRPSEAAAATVGRFPVRKISERRKTSQPHSTAETCFALVRSRVLLCFLALSHSPHKSLSIFQ